MPTFWRPFYCLKLCYMRWYLWEDVFFTIIHDKRPCLLCTSYMCTTVLYTLIDLQCWCNFSMYCIHLTRWCNAQIPPFCCVPHSWIYHCVARWLDWIEHTMTMQLFCYKTCRLADCVCVVQELNVSWMIVQTRFLKARSWIVNRNLWYGNHRMWFILLQKFKL